MFANRDYCNGGVCDVFVDTGGAALEVLKKSEGEWGAVGAPQEGNERKVSLKPAAGDVDLYRWSTSP